MFRYLSFTGWAAAVLLCLFIVQILVGSDGSFASFTTVDFWDFAVDIRGPRAFTAAFAGGAIAVAGTLSQAVFRNALATPSVLGTEAGAALGLSVYIASAGAFASTESVATASIIGAGAATIVALRFIRGRDALVRMLLGGFALSALLGAGTALITSWLLEKGQGPELYHWLLGSFSSRSWHHASLIGVCLATAFAAAIPLSGKLDRLSLGDDTAETLGIRVERLNLTALSLVAVLVGASIAVGGALPFVGLIVPHFTRLRTGPYLKPLLLNTLLSGAALTLAADFAARTVRYPVELNVGILTTLMGAPYFIWLLRRQTTL